MKDFYKRFGIDIGQWKKDGTLIPNTGKGQFVSVYSKGGIIQIIDETGEQNEAPEEEIKTSKESTTDVTAKTAVTEETPEVKTEEVKTDNVETPKAE